MPLSAPFPPGARDQWAIVEQLRKVGGDDRIAEMPLYMHALGQAHGPPGASPSHMAMMTSCQAPTSPGVIRMPVTPSRMISGIPPMRLPSTGTAHASAAMATYPQRLKPLPQVDVEYPVFSRSPVRAAHGRNGSGGRWVGAAV